MSTLVSKDQAKGKENGTDSSDTYNRGLQTFSSLTYSCSLDMAVLSRNVLFIWWVTWRYKTVVMRYGTRGPKFL